MSTVRAIYEYENLGRAVSIYQPGATGPGVRIITKGSCSIPDDEIPNLISALQAYMSRRAREVTREAKGGRQAQP